jgi:hypothetical protein
VSLKFWFWIWAAYFAASVVWFITDLVRGDHLLAGYDILLGAFAFVMMLWNSRRYHQKGRRP